MVYFTCYTHLHPLLGLCQPIQLIYNILNPSYSSTEIYKEILLCIIELLKDPQANVTIFDKLATVQDIDYEKQGTPKGSLSIKRKRTSMRLDQMKMLSRASSTSSVSETKVEKGKGATQTPETTKETARVSNINILLSLYEYVTTTPVETLIRPTVRTINALCRNSNGAETLLAELHRIERTARKSNYLTNAPRTKSEGSTGMVCKHNEAIIKANSDCVFLLPIIKPVISGTGEFVVCSNHSWLFCELTMLF